MLFLHLDLRPQAYSAPQEAGPTKVQDPVSLTHRALEGWLLAPFPSKPTYKPEMAASLSGSLLIIPRELCSLLLPISWFLDSYSFPLFLSPSNNLSRVIWKPPMPLAISTSIKIRLCGTGPQSLCFNLTHTSSQTPSHTECSRVKVLDCLPPSAEKKNKTSFHAVPSSHTIVLWGPQGCWDFPCSSPCLHQPGLSPFGWFIRPCLLNVSLNSTLTTFTPTPLLNTFTTTMEMLK